MSPNGADPSETVRVTVFVRPRSPIPGDRVEELGALPPSDRQYPSRAEFAAAHGADPADLAAVESFARSRGLQVDSASPSLRTVEVSGPASAIASAFGVAPGPASADPGSPRVAPGPVHLPPEIAPIVESVLGLDDRPYARPHGA